MNKMKKLLVCSLAVLMMLALTACAGKCDYCGKRITGSAYKSGDSVYCDDYCAGQSGLHDFLTDQMPSS